VRHPGHKKGCGNEIITTTYDGYVCGAGIGNSRLCTGHDAHGAVRSKAQHLQQKHLKTLMAIGGEIGDHKFPYPFYFSRVLDVDLAKGQAADQRSIRFDSYKNQTVLEITGNYYAAYSADRMDSYARLKETSSGLSRPYCRHRFRTFQMIPNFPLSQSKFRTTCGSRSWG
jgi:hypothetical protein